MYLLQKQKYIAFKKSIVMHILMVAAENDALPNAKVGGVADVIRDAPKALAAKNITVDVVIPDYGFELHNRIHVADVTVAFKAQLHVVSVFEIKQVHTHIKQLVISHPLFSQSKSVYCNDVGDRPFATDATKFALFSAAVCEALHKGVIKQPTTLHLHDWHSACVAVLLKFDPHYSALKTLHIAFTVHNLALQGIRPFKHDDSSLEAWFPSLSYNGEPLCDPRYPHCFNPMRAAINLADKVHLVSPSYSKEVLKPSDHSAGFFGGEGLENDLHNAAKAHKLEGILNGCEYSYDDNMCTDRTFLYQQIDSTLLSWIAKTDYVPSDYYIAHERIKSFLSIPSNGPLITSIGRLTEQKVLLLCQSQQQDLTIDGVCKIIAQFNGRLIMLGSGDPELERVFTKAMARNKNMLFLKGYGQGIGDLMYQRGDLFLMPSSFEPCGISQMLAMRAGQPCLVHGVGGLKDTIEHHQNGFSFNGDSLVEQSNALLKSLTEALTLRHNKPSEWQHIRLNAKEARFTWSQVVSKYIARLYK